MFHEPEFWVAISFFLFLGLLVYLKVPSLVTKALDARAEAIRKEIEEAARLREEAQKLLAKYEGMRKQAEQEAEEILAVAKQEAEAVVTEARKVFEELIERKRASADEKIRQASMHAVKEIRTRAADLSIAAAEEALSGRIKGAKATKLIDESVAAIKEKLH